MTESVKGAAYVPRLSASASGQANRSGMGAANDVGRDRAHPTFDLLPVVLPRDELMGVPDLALPEIGVREKPVTSSRKGSGRAGDQQLLLVNDVESVWRGVALR